MTAKYLQALKCLLAAYAIDPSHPTVHSQSIHFKSAIANATLPPKVAEVINAEFNLPVSKESPAELNEKFLSNHKNSARHVFSAMRVRSHLPSNDQAKNEAAILEVLSFPTISLEEAGEGLLLLQSWKSSQVAAYRSKAASKWPEATVFAATD